MRIDTLGPDLSRRRAIIAQVLRTRAVRQAVRQEIRDTKRTRRDGLLVARRHALEIAANYSHTFVRIAERILSRFLTRVYDGIEVRNAEYLDRLPPACEIVYMPCHRSHVDYLLLSYVIYQRGYAVPYVAAGLNLNLPVIGRLLRKGGAFYIRRSFRGSGLYPIVFMKYVDVMMNRGHPIEFFIEGGRSRTGRLLRPRTGMLGMTVRSYLRDTRRPVAYVPVYFGYDKLLEGEAYIDELMGRPKDKESVGGLLGVLPQLRSELGRVHVSFGEPLLLDSMLDKVHAGWRQDPLDEDSRPAWFGEAVDAVAGEIMRRINAAAAVTPVNLLSVALLAAPRQAMLETRPRTAAPALHRPAEELSVFAGRVGRGDRRLIDHQARRADGPARAAQAPAGRRAADGGEERGACDLLPQQRPASLRHALARRLRLPQQLRDAARRHPAPAVARLSVRACGALPALAR